MSKSREESDTNILGVISDTHGILTPEAVEALKGVDLIIHAGDIDKPGILKALRGIAPVVAVRGNMDKGAWTKGLPQSKVIQVGEISLYVIHDVYGLDIDPATAGIDAVISGHTHHPSLEQNDEVLFLNPGSAGWPRNNYPASVAIVRVVGRTMTPTLIELKA